MNYRLFLRPDAPRWEVAEWNFKSRCWQTNTFCAPISHCRGRCPERCFAQFARARAQRR